MEANIWGCAAQTHSFAGAPSSTHAARALQLGDMCVANFQVAPLWFGAQLAFNFSLSMTNVTSNTILSSTSGLFTYGLSCLLLGEAYTLVKLLFILVCIAGAPPPLNLLRIGSNHTRGACCFVALSKNAHLLWQGRLCKQPSAWPEVAYRS